MTSKFYQSQKTKTNVMKKLTILDTFSGIGGFSYAAERLVGGFETKQFVENNPYCQKILKKHFPTVPIHDDIRTYTAKPFQFDLLCGGFPCQDISVAGQRKGITEETRSGLFFELVRLIRLVRPKYILLENVAAILNDGLDIVLGQLSEAGYDAEWSIISAQQRGACHKRERIWIIAYPMCKGLQGRRGKFKLQKNSGERQIIWRSQPHLLNPNWKGYLSQPTVCRGNDGLSNRVDRLRALGNSIVPAVATIPLGRILDLENYEH